MINESGLQKYFWTDAIRTACYVLNRILICPILNKTPYELLKGRNQIYHIFMYLVANSLC